MKSFVSRGWIPCLVLVLAVLVIYTSKKPDTAVAVNSERSAAPARPGGSAPIGVQLDRDAQPAMEWQDNVTYEASGPFLVDLSLIPPGIYDPNNKLDSGDWGGRIESPLSDEEVERLQQEAMLLPEDAGIFTEGASEDPASRAPVAGVAFDALDVNNCCGGGGTVPPDPEMAAGPNHVIAVVNVAFAIYDKTGTLVSGPTTFSSFFAGTPGCNNGPFDPNVLYDEEFDRFILAADGGGTTYCVAATETSDPTGSWNRYGFSTNISGAFFDFPHAGVGRDAIYMGSNQFTGGFFEGRLFAMDKFAMYDGDPLSVVSRSTGSSSTPQPANLHGFNQGTWPTGGPHYIMTEVFDGANHTVWTWNDPFGANVLTAQGNVNLSAASGVTAGFPVNAPQAGSGATLQANDWRGQSTEWRNGFLWMSNTVACNPGGGTVDCVRWAQIDPTGPSVVQAGVFGSSGDYRFFPDVATNHCNDMAIGYTKSSTSIFPSIFVNGRESSDAAGTLQSETMLKAGEVAYTAFDGSPHRWGDYSGMTIDPDGETFWYLGEYSKSFGGSAGWGTYIGSFTFPGCSSGGNTAPSVTITSPANGSTFTDGDLIGFVGTATDTQDGGISASLSWSSSIDGAIGGGASFSTSALSVGTHTIIASVTDSGGLPGSDSITVTVNPVGGVTVDTFLSVDTEDGYVLESSETSGVGGTAKSGASVMWAGDFFGERQAVTVVSFPTGAIPDGATILSAQLRLLRSGQLGQNPFDTHGPCYADVQTGGFGGNVALQPSDFQAGATAPESATLSNAAVNLDWSEGDLNAAGLAAINVSGTTQVRVRFDLDDNDDGAVDVIGYFAGDTANASQRPQLVVTYSTGGGNTAPTVTISSPANGSTFTDGDSVSFAGTATDTEDGGISGSLSWSSSIDGAIGGGGAFSTSTLSVGVHTITASVTDSGGLPGSDSITVTVDPVGSVTEETFMSVDIEDGYILETSETSGVGGTAKSGASVMWAGDFFGERQAVIVVSFPTAAIPDGATILSAQLRLRRSGQLGGNPFDTHGPCYADVQTGGFGGNVALQPSDFQAGATAPEAATLSNAVANLDWSEGDLNAAGLAAIDVSGTTQVRVRFDLDDNDDNGVDVIGYFTGDSADGSQRPQLVVTYQE